MTTKIHLASPALTPSKGKIIGTTTAGTNTIAMNARNLGKLKTDDHIVVFGAGKETELAAPEAPIIATQTGTAEKQYRVVAITEDMGFTEPSDIGTVVAAPKLNKREVAIIPKPVPNAYQYLIYSKGTSDDKFTLAGFLIAHPQYGKHNSIDGKPEIADALKNFYPTPRETWFNFFLDKKHLVLEDSNVPPYIPFELPERSRAGFLRTKVTEVDTATKIIIVRDLPNDSIERAMIFHDNYEVIQSALDNYESITIEKGKYPTFGNLRIHLPVLVNGELMSDRMAIGSDAVIDFQGGYGLELGENASRSVFEDIVFYQHHPNRMPSGGKFISPEGVHGCGVLAEKRASWIRCLFTGFQGAGHVVLGVVRNDTNANNSFFENCISKQNKGHGFYAGGDNANACLYLSCSATNNSLWGFKDDSFLGNHFIACHTDSNYAPFSLADGNNNHGTLIGCYSEVNQRPSEILSATQVGMGGIHAAGFSKESSGLRFLGKRVEPFIFNQGMIHTEFANRNAHRDDGYLIRFKSEKIGCDFKIAVVDSYEDFNDKSANEERKKMVGILNLPNATFLQSLIVLFRMSDKVHLKIFDAYNEKIVDLQEPTITSSSALDELKSILAKYPEASDNDFSNKNESLAKREKKFAFKNLERLNELCIEIAGLPHPEQTITLENNLTYDQSVANSPRVEFNVGRQYNQTRGMAWSILNPRGSGLMVFNRGLIFGINNKGRKIDYERKICGIENEKEWQIGTYRKGDVIFDISGDNYFLFPTENFGITNKKWKKKTALYIGEIIHVGNEIYYVAAFTIKGIITGASGKIEPNWNTSGEIVDNELIWKKWGTSAAVDSDGKNKFERLGRKTLSAEIDITLAPGEVKDFKVPFNGAQIGDSVVATPLNINKIITWNAFLEADSDNNIDVVVRIQNHEKNVIQGEKVEWVFDAWKH